MVAETAATLSTPLPALLEMDWADVILWHTEARRISRAGVKT